MVEEEKNMVESIGVRVPSKSSSSTSSPPSSPPNCCSHARDTCCTAQLMMQSHAKLKRSGAPARFMYFNHDGTWLDFSSEVLSSLKPAFLHRKPMADVSLGGSRYVFDFLRMLQIDFESGKQRSIAWIDENGKCFFPKVFIVEDFEDCLDESENLKIEIEVRIDGNSIKRKREGLDKEEAEVSSRKKQEGGEYASKRQRLSLPDAEKEKPRWPNARLLREGERAYVLARDYFLSGIRKIDPGATITAIHQCTRLGHLEAARFQVFQKQIEITKATRGASNTVYAWHGTSAKGVESILAHGFGVPRKVSGLESHGVGVYLSPVGLPHLSAKLSEMDDNGEKHIILCRVILGNVEKVEAGSQQCYPTSADFDTGADEPKNPKWYVVWSSIMNKHIIPEFVVSFNSSNHVQGQVRGSTCMKYSLEKLLSKLRSLLIPSKIGEVVTLYDAFRAGKLAKHIFITQLRRIAGDEVLLSTIREIRGSE